MKKIPKLYTKNNKGRYDEYKIPECDTSDTFYQKINGRYEPACMLLHDSLPEGVWVVSLDIVLLQSISAEHTFVSASVLIRSLILSVFLCQRWDI